MFVLTQLERDHIGIDDSCQYWAWCFPFSLFFSFLLPPFNFKSGWFILKNVWIFSLTSSVQFSSVSHSCPTLCDPMNSSMPRLPVHHQLLEFTQTHVHWVGDAIQASFPLFSPSPPTFNLSQHQGFFKWVNSLNQVAKVLELQLQHQSFQWVVRTDFL